MCHSVMIHMAVAVSSERAQVLEALHLPAEVLSLTPLLIHHLNGLHGRHMTRVRMKKYMLKE